MISDDFDDVVYEDDNLGVPTKIADHPCDLGIELEQSGDERGPDSGVRGARGFGRSEENGEAGDEAFVKEGSE